MTNIYDLKLSDLLPSSIKGDEKISALAEALSKQLQEITDSIYDSILLTRIDELDEAVVDSLAWQFHVDFYEPLGLSLNKKRALVKNSIKWHRNKGTKSALEELIRILYFDDFYIEEWFEYGGEPYFFRCVANGDDISKENYNNFINALFSLKNVRSHLEEIKFITKISSTQKYGCVFLDVGYITMPSSGLQ